MIRIAVFSLLCWNAVFADTPKPVLALNGLDPVALVDGKETAGNEKLTVNHGLFTYRFVSEANRKLFTEKPEEYGIQFGGACGRMGPFSGNGAPGRYHVHERRIYVFASEACRESFKRSPTIHIEQANPVPTGTVDELRRGAELVDLVVKGMGGAEAVDGVQQFQRITHHNYKQGDKDYPASHQVLWSFPNQVRVVEVFSKPYGYMLQGQTGSQIAGEEQWPLAPYLAEVARRQVLRDPLLLVKHRRQPGFIAVARGKETIDGKAVELVDVAMNGATSTWGIELATGHVVESTYTARRSNTVGLNVIKYSEFNPVQGIVLPHVIKESFNGKEQTTPIKKIESYRINDEVKDELFNKK